MGRPSQAAPSPATAARLRCRSRIRRGETVNTSCGRRHARQQGPGHSSREVRAACTTAGGCARIRCAAVPGYPPTTALLQPPAPVHVTDADPGGITGPCMPRPRRAARRLEQWQGQAPLRVVIAGPPGRHQGLDAGWGAGPRQQGCWHRQVADVNRIPSAGGHSARIVELPLDVVLRERGKCRQEDRRHPSRVFDTRGSNGDATKARLPMPPHLARGAIRLFQVAPRLPAHGGAQARHYKVFKQLALVGRPVVPLCEHAPVHAGRCGECTGVGCPGWRQRVVRCGQHGCQLGVEGRQGAGQICLAHSTGNTSEEAGGNRQGRASVRGGRQSGEGAIHTIARLHP